MDVNNTVFIQRAEMDGLFGQTRDFTHLNISAADQVNILQCTGAQLEQFQRQRVFFRLAFLGNVPQ